MILATKLDGVHTCFGANLTAFSSAGKSWYEVGCNVNSDWRSGLLCSDRSNKHLSCGQMVESLPSKWETGVRIQVVSYQRQLKWYLMLPVPCKEFSIQQQTGGSSLQQPDGPWGCLMCKHTPWAWCWYRMSQGISINPIVHAECLAGRPRVPFFSVFGMTRCPWWDLHLQPPDLSANIITSWPQSWPFTGWSCLL